MIVASLCTIPSRKDSLKRVLRQILCEQTCSIHQFHVWLNGYTAIDTDLARDARLNYHLCPDNPGPWMRYRTTDLLELDDILVTLDDDLDYPQDYVERGCYFLSQRDDKNAISFGGIRWDYTVPLHNLSFGSDRHFWGLISPVETHQRVALPLGALCFYKAYYMKGIISTRLKGFRTNDDMMIGWQLQQRGVKIMCCPSPEGWVKMMPIASNGDALAIRDRSTRHRTFRQMVTQLEFDPTADRLADIMKQARRIMVMAEVCPPLPGSSQLDTVLRSLCAQDTSIHLVAPFPVSQAGRVQSHVNTPYEVHAIAVPERGGRLDNLAPVRAWRNWRVDRNRMTLWNARVAQARAKLQPTAEYRFIDGKLLPV